MCYSINPGFYVIYIALNTVSVTVVVNTNLMKNTVNPPFNDTKKHKIIS